MDGLHGVLRAIRGESKAQARDHLDIFREFIDRLDEAARRRPARPAKPMKLNEGAKRK